MFIRKVGVSCTLTLIIGNCFRSVLLDYYSYIRFIHSGRLEFSRPVYCLETATELHTVLVHNSRTEFRTIVNWLTPPTRVL